MPVTLQYNVEILVFGLSIADHLRQAQPVLDFFEYQNFIFEQLARVLWNIRNLLNKLI